MYAQELYNFSENNIIKCNEINDICLKCNYIISSIPFSKDNINIYAPFSSKKLEIKNVIQKMKNKIFISGAINEDVKYLAQENNITIIDLMKNEKLTILNIIPTVEGAIQIAMEKTRITINNSNCLILGFGRIGKLLSKYLYNLGAKVSCMARNTKDLAWIKALNYNPVSIANLDNELNRNYAIIFNTIPAMILDSNKLKLIKNEETLIIELASMPGGIDFAKAEEYKINVVKALGLPGKVAPVTAAKYIKEILDEIL